MDFSVHQVLRYSQVLINSYLERKEKEFPAYFYSQLRIFPEYIVDIVPLDSGAESVGLQA